MKLYHYTSYEHLMEIIHDGFIKPARDRFINKNGTVEEKAVVSFTTETDIEKAAYETGISGGHRGRCNKNEVAIMVETFGSKAFKKWDEWAVANDIEKEWFQDLKATAPGWRKFYVCENIVPVNDINTRITFRPDIAKAFGYE